MDAAIEIDTAKNGPFEAWCDPNTFIPYLDPSSSIESYEYAVLQLALQIFHLIGHVRELGRQIFFLPFVPGEDMSRGLPNALTICANRV